MEQQTSTEPAAPKDITLKSIGIIRNNTTVPQLAAGEDGLKMNDESGTTLKKFHETSDAPSEIIIREELADLLDGIEDYSHIVVLYWGHEVTDAGRSLKKVHPVGRTDYPLTGIFTTCSPARPNPVLMTVVRLKGRENNTLTVSGLDAIDRSPVLDIKPYVGAQYPQNDVFVPEWMERIMNEYRTE